MRRTLVPAFLIAAVWSLTVGASALAVSPMRLQGHVTDQAGVLGGQTGQVQDALDTLLRDHDVELFVAFVDTTGDLTSTEWADETARMSSLGANDALLVVAMQDHTDAIWVSDALAPTLTDPELNTIIADDLEPSLRAGDFAGAAVAAAKGIGEAAAPAPPATVPPIDGGGPVGPTAPSIDLGPIVGFAFIVLGIVIVGLWLASRLSARRESDERDRQTGQLARQANASLVAMDDRLKGADQEAGFVEAEFGEDEAKPFHDAVASAREELRAAFVVRQKLDDEVPEDPPTREAMLKEIVDRCGRAAAALDAQAARIKVLRDLEEHAPQVLASLDAPLAAQEARLPGAEQTLASLASYADSATSSIKGNVGEARKGLAGAKAAMARAKQSLTGNDAHAAAVAVATAQDGIAGAKGLLDAVDAAAAAIRDAEAKLPDELAAARKDLEDAKAAAGPAGLDAAQAGHAATLASAGTAFASASAAAAAPARDPVAALGLVTAARRSSAEVLAAVRQDAAEQARLVAAIDAEIATTRHTIDDTQQFITTRLHGVGRQARTRLAAAQDALQRAVAERDTDPKTALADARRAGQLANDAYTLASRDFGQFDAGRGGGAGSDIGGAILGGIIGGILAGGMRGGRRGGGWGGSPWGGGGGGGGGGIFGGGGGWGGGGGHSVGGGFGGFGGGGGGGGGGGHSVGGHW